MPPPWIPDLLGYAEWLRRTAEASGGTIEGPTLDFELIPGLDGQPAALRMPQQRIFFGEGFSLSTMIYTNDRLENELYSFHLLNPDHVFVWRLCKNDHHLIRDRQATHIHVPVNVRLRFPEVDLDNVIEFVWEHLSTGVSMPPPT